jgi:hypothetical protein
VFGRFRLPSGSSSASGSRVSMVAPPSNKALKLTSLAWSGGLGSQLSAVLDRHLRDRSTRPHASQLARYEGLAQS